MGAKTAAAFGRATAAQGESECEAADTRRNSVTTVQTDPVAAALASALDAWMTTKNKRSLRRTLLDLLGVLEELEE